MGLTHMLDTDVAIAAITGRSKALLRHLEENESGLCVSVIIYAELRFGTAKSRNFAKNASDLGDFISLLTVLPFSRLAAEHYGDIRADLERAGRVIGGNDLLIAAHARAEGVTLVTNNIREFGRVPGLRTETWLR